MIASYQPSYSFLEVSSPLIAYRQISGLTKKWWYGKISGLVIEEPKI
jgi:hypothetical protein